MAENLDMELESLLRGTLKAEAASLPVAIGPGDVRRRLEVRRRQRASRRLRLLLVAALMALPLGALAAGLLRLDPSPGYSAVLLRTAGDPEIQVLLARDGATQRVVDVPASRFGEFVPQLLEASVSGWIALWAVDVPEATDGPEATHNEYVVLFDVRDAYPPIVRAGTSHGAWTPDGRYWSATNDAYELIDPVSGAVINLSRGVTDNLDGWSVGDRMIVAADGSGLLVGDSGNVVQDGAGRPYPQRWGVLSPAGTLSEGLPELAEGMGSRMISARWGLLQRCEAWAHSDCPVKRTGTIVSGPAIDGSYRPWGGQPPPHDHVIGASWAIDGGLWLLVDRRSGERAIVLIHRDAENVDREVATFPVSLDEEVTIGDLAPDDSLVALDMSRTQTVIVETSTGRSHLFDGAFGGFVPAASAMDWISGDVATEAGQLLARPEAGDGSERGYAALPGLQKQLDSRVVDRGLLVHEVEATAAEPGAVVKVVLGPVELEEGIGMLLSCSGPGEITVTEIGPDGPETPSTYGCLNPRSYHGHEVPTVRWESAMVQVEYDPSTTWRLIVYDPPPATPRPSR